VSRSTPIALDEHQAPTRPQNTAPFCKGHRWLGKCPEHVAFDDQVEDLSFIWEVFGVRLAQGHPEAGAECFGLRKSQHFLCGADPKYPVAKTGQLECQKASAAANVKDVNGIRASPAAQTNLPGLLLRRSVQSVIRRIVESCCAGGPMTSDGIFDGRYVKSGLVHRSGLTVPLDR
jgi:hypothetical protein